MTSPSFFEFLSTSWDHILELAIGHAIVVAISLAIAIVIGVSLGVLVYRREQAANVALAITTRSARKLPSSMTTSTPSPLGSTARTGVSSRILAPWARARAMCVALARRASTRPVSLC